MGQKRNVLKLGGVKDLVEVERSLKTLMLPPQGVLETTAAGTWTITLFHVRNAVICNLMPMSGN